MIPTTQLPLVPVEEATTPSKTYKILTNKNRINGYADDLEAVAQSIYLILNSERYKHPIYSWDYGVELVDLYGKPMSYVISEIQRRITEALIQDDRIEEVDNFTFEKNGRKLHTTFEVHTIYGTLQAEREVAT